MKDLLVIAPGFPKDEADDGCIPPLQAYIKAYTLRHPKASVRVIATQYPFHRKPYAWHGVQVHPCGGANQRWAKPLAWQRAVSIGARLYRERPFQRVHSFWLGECAWIGKRLSWRTGASHVLTLMGQDARDEHNWWRVVKGGASKNVVLSERHAEAFSTMSGRPPDAIIPWGLDPLDASSGTKRDIDLLFAGSLIPVKRPELFIELVARIVQHRPVKAVMAGARIPVGNAHVDGLVVGAGLADSIDVLGEVPRAEMLKLMARSRVLVHPSRYESQGYVFLEALMQGMSVVSYPVGIASPSERWSVVSDPEAMATAVEALLSKPVPQSAWIGFTMDDTLAAYDRIFDQPKTPKP
ncbi:MAG: glycosyltransferase family 4 protein [Flavobacteriales bacterium]|nr:glycosyltransferase family 4 protein [Flavobacteriales bacterium]